MGKGSPLLCRKERSRALKKGFLTAVRQVMRENLSTLPDGRQATGRKVITLVKKLLTCLPTGRYEAKNTKQGKTRQNTD